MKTQTNVGAYLIEPTTTLSPEVQKIFKDATSSLVGVRYTPLILVGTQIVSGQNYKFIAQMNVLNSQFPKTLVNMTIYVPFEGIPVILNINQLISEYGVAGGWKVVGAVNKLPQQIATAFSELFSNIDGVGYNPLVYVGEQLVHGKNHMIYCEQTLVTQVPQRHLVSVVLHETLEGEYSILSIGTIE